MNKTTFTVFILGIAAGLVITAGGCSTLKDRLTVRSDIRGLVYDEHNQPVSGFEIEVSGRYRAVSDVNGRFVLHNIPLQNHFFSASVPAGPVMSGELILRDKKEIIYLRSESAHSRYRRIGEHLVSGKPEDALQLLEAFREPEKQTGHWMLYQGIALWQAGRSADALETLRRTTRHPDQSHKIAGFISYLETLSSVSGEVPDNEKIK